MVRPPQAEQDMLLAMVVQGAAAQIIQVGRVQLDLVLRAKDMLAVQVVMRPMAIMVKAVAAVQPV
jgi:hypothetical protein